MFPHGNIMSSRDLPSVSNKGIQDNDRQNIEYFQALRASPTGQIHEYRSYRAAFCRQFFIHHLVHYLLSVRFLRRNPSAVPSVWYDGSRIRDIERLSASFPFGKKRTVGFSSASEKHRILLYPADITLLSLRGYFRLPPFRKPGDDD